MTHRTLTQRAAAIGAAALLTLIATSPFAHAARTGTQAVSPPSPESGIRCDANARIELEELPGVDRFRNRSSAVFVCTNKRVMVCDLDMRVAGTRRGARLRHGEILRVVRPDGGNTLAETTETRSRKGIAVPPDVRIKGSIIQLEASCEVAVDGVPLAVVFEAELAPLGDGWTLDTLEDDAVGYVWEE